MRRKTQNEQTAGASHQAAHLPGAATDKSAALTKGPAGLGQVQTLTSKFAISNDYSAGQHRQKIAGTVGSSQAPGQPSNGVSARQDSLGANKHRMAAQQHRGAPALKDPYNQANADGARSTAESSRTKAPQHPVMGVPKLRIHTDERYLHQQRHGPQTCKATLNQIKMQSSLNSKPNGEGGISAHRNSIKSTSSVHELASPSRPLVSVPQSNTQEGASVRNREEKVNGFKGRFSLKKDVHQLASPKASSPKTKGNQVRTQVYKNRFPPMGMIGMESNTPKMGSNISVFNPRKSKDFLQVNTQYEGTVENGVIPFAEANEPLTPDDTQTRVVAPASCRHNGTSDQQMRFSDHLEESAGHQPLTTKQAAHGERQLQGVPKSQSPEKGMFKNSSSFAMPSKSSNSIFSQLQAVANQRPKAGKTDDAETVVENEKKPANNRLNNVHQYQSKQYHNTNVVKKVNSFKLQAGIAPSQASDKALKPKVMKIKEKESVKDTPARQRGAIAPRPSQLFAQKTTTNKNNYHTITTQQSAGARQIQTDNDLAEKNYSTLTCNAKAENPPLTDRSEQLTRAFEAIDQSDKGMVSPTKPMNLHGLHSQSNQQTLQMPSSTKMGKSITTKQQNHEVTKRRTEKLDKSKKLELFSYFSPRTGRAKGTDKQKSRDDKGNYNTNPFPQKEKESLEAKKSELSRQYASLLGIQKSPPLGETVELNSKRTSTRPSNQATQGDPLTQRVGAQKTTMKKPDVRLQLNTQRTEEPETPLLKFTEIEEGSNENSDNGKTNGDTNSRPQSNAPSQHRFLSNAHKSLSFVTPSHQHRPKMMLQGCSTSNRRDAQKKTENSPFCKKALIQSQQPKKRVEISVKVEKIKENENRAGIGANSTVPSHFKNSLVERGSINNNQESAQGMKTNPYVSKQPSQKDLSEFIDGFENQQLHDSYSVRRNADQALDGYKTSERKPTQAKKAEIAALEKMHSQQNLHKPKSDGANVLNFFSSAHGRADEELESHEVTQIQQLKSSIVNSEFGIVSSSKQLGNSDQKSNEKQSKEATKTKQFKGIPNSSANGAPNRQAETSNRQQETRKLKQKYLTQTLANEAGQNAIDSMNVDDYGAQAYATNPSTASKPKKINVHHAVNTAAAKKKETTESAAAEAKQSNWGIVTSGKQTQKNQASAQHAAEPRNTKESANKNGKPPGGRVTLLQGTVKQSADTPLQFCYTDSKTVKKVKNNPQSHKFNSLTVHHLGAKDSPATKAEPRSRQCIREVTVSKPWPAGVGSSLTYQQNSYAFFGRRRPTASGTQLVAERSRTFEQARGSVPSKNLPPLVHHDILQKSPYNKFASGLPSPEKPERQHSHSNEPRLAKVAAEEADIFIEQECLFVGGPQNSATGADPKQQRQLLGVLSPDGLVGRRSHGHPQRTKAPTYMSKGLVNGRLTAATKPSNMEPEGPPQDKHADVIQQTASKELIPAMNQSQPCRNRPLSAQSSSLMKVRGVPLLKTGGATSLINAGKCQNIVSSYNSSLAVCSSLSRSYNLQTTKAVNVKQVDLIAAMNSAKDKDGGKKEGFAAQSNPLLLRANNPKGNLNQSATSERGKAKNNAMARCSPFEAYGDNLIGRKKIVLSQSPLKDLDTPQIWKTNKQNTENSSINFGMVKDSGKASNLSHAPRIKSMTDKNNKAASSIQSRQVQSSLLLPQNSGQQSPLDSSQSSDFDNQFNDPYKSEQLGQTLQQPQIQIKKLSEGAIDAPHNTSLQNEASLGALEISPQGIGLQMNYLGSTRNNNQSLNQSSFQKNQLREKDVSENRTFNSSSSNDFSNMDEKLAVGHETQKPPVNDERPGHYTANWQEPKSQGGAGINGVKETSPFLKASKLYSKNSRAIGHIQDVYNVKGSQKNVPGKHPTQAPRQLGQRPASGSQRWAKTMRTVTSEGWDDQSSPDLNDDDLNTPSARASLANFDENLKGDQIELKYFLSDSDQFNSFKVLKRQQQGGNGGTTSKAIDAFKARPYLANYQLNNGNLHGLVHKHSRNSDLVGASQMSHNASKRLSKSQMSQTKSPRPQTQRMKKEYASKLFNPGIFKEAEGAKAIASPSPMQTLGSAMDMLEQRPSQAKRQVVPCLNLAPIICQQEQQTRLDPQSTQAKFDTSRSDPLHVQQRSKGHCKIVKADLPNTNRNSQSSQTLDKIRQRRKRVNTIFIGQQEVMELRKRSQRDLNTDRGRNQNRGSSAKEGSLGPNYQSDGIVQGFLAEQGPGLLKAKGTEDFGAMPQILKIRMDGLTAKNAAQSPRFNQSRDTKFRSEPRTQGRDSAIRSQGNSISGYEQPVAIGTINAKSKKRVQFILEETQENDESNTAALSEANPSQSFDDFNRLDTIGSSAQDQPYAKARNLASFSSKRHNSHLQRQRQASKQKQALRAFERKVRAERRNAEEIAYQFIYNQNMQQMQQQMSQNTDEGRTPTENGHDAETVRQELQE